MRARGWSPRAVAVALALAAALPLWGAPRTAAQEILFFPNGCQEILFFAPCPAPPQLKEAAFSPARPSPAKPRQSKEEEYLFADPVVGPDGSLRIYIPPKPVRDVLDDPNPKTARAYQEWTLKRLARVQAAQDALNQLNGTPSGPGAAEVASLTAALGGRWAPATASPAPQTSSAPTGAARTVAPIRGPGRGVELVYLLATWCPHCAKQTPVIAELARRHPEVAVTAIALDSAPDTIEPYAEGLPFQIRLGTDGEKASWGVRGYPTLVVLRDGVPVQRFLGETSLETLEVALGVNAALR